MKTEPGTIRLEPERLTEVLQTDVVARVERAEGELDLDLSAILRVDGAAARALEELAQAADLRENRIRLRNVNVNVYKTLMLLNLVRRFTFAD